MPTVKPNFLVLRVSKRGTEPVTQSNWLVACYLRGLMFDGAVFQGNSFWSRPTGMVSANRGVPQSASVQCTASSVSVVAVGYP